MLRLERRRQIDWSLGKLQLIAGTAVVAFGAILKADLTQLDALPALQSIVKWMQGSAWLVVVTGPLMVGLVQGARKRFGSPWAWEAIQKLLDEYRNDIFGRLDEPLDHHRVTLFQYRRYAVGRFWPWTDWLVAVARSDHLTKLRIQRFRAPDDGEYCEGVAGRAWRSKSWVIVPNEGSNLPDLTTGSTDQDVETYARETSVEALSVRKRLGAGKLCAASYAALTIQLKGRPWGVVVLDSRKTGTITRDDLDGFKAFGTVLTPLLERV